MRSQTATSDFVADDYPALSERILFKVKVWWHSKGREYFYKMLFLISCVLSFMIVIGEFSIMF